MQDDISPRDFEAVGNENHEIQPHLQDYLVESLDNSEEIKNRLELKCLIENFNPAEYGACTMELGYVFNGMFFKEVRDCSCKLTAVSFLIQSRSV
ncbi:MAG: hypothetical protein OEZ34_08905 [Spirochaetia bacterium]|nr:hypothetical protein [Spirochaetia bacterium]